MWSFQMELEVVVVSDLLLALRHGHGPFLLRLVGWSDGGMLPAAATSSRILFEPCQRADSRQSPAYAPNSAQLAP